jgi:hypothetical protein
MAAPERTVEIESPANVAKREGPSGRARGQVSRTDYSERFAVRRLGRDHIPLRVSPLRRARSTRGAVVMSARSSSSSQPRMKLILQGRARKSEATNISESAAPGTTTIHQA